jgi:hypothetical protein
MGDAPPPPLDPEVAQDGPCLIAGSLLETVVSELARDQSLVMLTPPSRDSQRWPSGHHHCLGIGEDVEAVVVRTLQENPDDATHWSTRSMTKTTGMSQSAISRIWRAFGLKPHPVDTFKLSSDPLFIDEVRDIVVLYICPPDHAVVLCVDEKT